MTTHEILIFVSAVTIFISSILTIEKINTFYLGIAIFVLSFLF